GDRMEGGQQVLAGLRIGHRVPIDGVGLATKPIQTAETLPRPGTDRVDVHVPGWCGGRSCCRPLGIVGDSFHTARAYRPEYKPTVPTGYPWLVARRQSGMRPRGTLCTRVPQ